MSRKGVTPVIATVLLIAISVSAVVTASVFIGDMVGDVRQNIARQLGVQNKEQKSEITVIQGYNDGGNIMIEVRNEGDISLYFKKNGDKMWNLYVDGKPGPSGWGASSSTLSSQSDILIDPHETLMIDTNEAFPSTGNSKTLELNGQYGISSAIVCDNVNGENSC